MAIASTVVPVSAMARTLSSKSLRLPRGAATGLLQHRDPLLLGPWRMIGRETALVDLAQRLGAVAVALQQVRGSNARRVADERNRPGDVAVHDGERRLAALVTVDPAVSGVVAGSATVDADEVDDDDHAVEDLDADPRPDFAKWRVELLQGDRQRALPGDAALGRRCRQQRWQPGEHVGARCDRQRADSRGERQRCSGERPVGAGSGLRHVHDLAPVWPVKRLSVKRTASVLGGQSPRSAPSTFPSVALHNTRY